MLKIISLIGFLGFYFSAFGQKASYYKDASVDMNQFQFFYMPNSTLDAHNLTNPFLDKKSLNDTDYWYFSLYNELSLKNMTLLDGHGGVGAFEIFIYEGSTFEKRISPIGYKPKKIKGRFLVIDAVNSTNETLVWRGWIDLKKIKNASGYRLYQRAICLLLTNLKIEPVITE